jgi:uncharacterized protein (DUF1015 family)
MTDVRPFRAVRYDPDRVELSNVIVPPYDVVQPEERAAFYDRDPHNAIRFELVRDVADEASADYEHIADELAQWRARGVLLHDDEPALYVMRQRFRAPSGEWLERTGFFAELGLADYSEGTVLPHERTLAGPKADRLKLLVAARANLSSVFLLYEDRAAELEPLLDAAIREALLATARDDAGVEYQLAGLRGADAERVCRFLASRPAVIADGHHRYETALRYRDDQRAAGRGGDAPSEATLAFFANAYAEGSLLLAIHRVIRKVPAPTDALWNDRLPGWEQQRVAMGDGSDIAATLDEHLAPLAGRPAFAADDGSGVLRIFSRPEPLGDRLMVRLLEDDVIGSVFGLDSEAIRGGAVTFKKHPAHAAREVRTGDGTVALYLNPLKPDDVFRVTRAGEVMPQKSTFFYPKVPTGMVFRVHEDPGT